MKSSNRLKIKLNQLLLHYRFKLDEGMESQFSRNGRIEIRERFYSQTGSNLEFSILRLLLNSEDE